MSISYAGRAAKLDDQLPPFATGAPYYPRGGWPDLLPVNDKRPVVQGFHGRKRKRASDDTIKRWIKRYAEYNIALALPRDVLGIDVDHYGDKRGGDTLQKLETDLGPLPQTVWSTSRTDYISGIRLFRVPADFQDVDWPGDAGNDIDVIAWFNRYVIVAPSRHKSGKPYRWIRAGEPVGIPGPDTLPFLPDDWCEYLASKKGSSNGDSVHRAYYGPALDWLNEYGHGEMCLYMAEAAPGWANRLSDGSAYEAMKNATAQAIKATAEGHQGVNAALRPMRSAYIARVSARGPRERRRSEPEAVEEWRRAVSGAISKFGGRIASTDEICDEWSDL